MDFEKIATWLALALVGLLQFIGLAQIRRIGVLETSKAEKSDVKDLIEELRVERISAEESRKELHEKLNKLSVGVARLQGRLLGAGSLGRQSDPDTSGEL